VYEYYDVITSCIDIKGGIDKDHDHIPSPMSRRIVSWKTSEPRHGVSPAVSSASLSGGSVVSINSIVSDMMTTETTGVQPAELGVKLTNWPGGTKPSTVESFLQHKIYFFKDGNVTFLVRGFPSLCCESDSLKKVCRSMAHSIVFIDTFSLGTRYTSPPNSASSTSVIMNL